MELTLFGGGDTPAHYIPTFDEWYARFPKKQGKVKASERWAKMSPPERAAAWAALPAWEDYARRHPQGNTFVPMASTWLNQSRWADDVPDLPVNATRNDRSRSAISRLLTQPREELNP